MEKGIKKLALEIELSIIFIPKTFFKMLFTPKWSSVYAQNQLSLDEEKRFNDYSHPVLFLVLGVLPLVYFLLGSNEQFFPEEILNFLKFFKNLFPNVYLILILAFFSINPAIAGAISLWAGREPLTKDKLYPQILIWSYYFGFFWLLYFFGIFVAILFKNNPSVSTIPFLTINIYLVYYYIKLFKFSSSVSWGRIFKVHIPVFIFSLLVLFSNYYWLVAKEGTGTINHTGYTPAVNPYALKPSLWEDQNRCRKETEEKSKLNNMTEGNPDVIYKNYYQECLRKLGHTVTD